MRLLDRLLDFTRDESPLVEAIPLGPDEIDDLWLRYGRTLLDAAVDGVPLLGEERWDIWRSRVRKVLADGVLERRKGTWIWHRDNEPADSGRLELHRQMAARVKARRASSK